MIKNRTIAFLDILGFTTLVEKHGVARIGQVYSNGVRLASAYAKNQLEGETCKVCIFSDSIAIFSSTDSLNGFLAVATYVNCIMRYLIPLQLPIRGAIAFGDMFINENRSIFLGNGYLKAVRLEKKQSWIGVSIDSSAENAFQDFFQAHNLIQEINLPDGKSLSWYKYPTIIKYEVPMEGGEIEPMFTINWLNKLHCLDAKGVNIPHEKIVKIVQDTLGKYDDNNHIKEKYLNTLKYIQYINSTVQFPDGLTGRYISKTTAPIS